MVTKNQLAGLLIFIAIGQLLALIMWLKLDKNYAFFFFIVSVSVYLLIGQLIKYTNRDQFQ